MSTATDEQRVNALVDELLEKFPPKQVSTTDFLGAQFDLGLAWVHFDEGLGGLGLNPKMQKLINERIYAGAQRVETRAGHGAGKPTSKQIEEAADIYSFLLWRFGVPDFQPLP